MDASQTFSRRLREAREAQGLSQRDLTSRLRAIGLRINQAAIVRIERGERKIPLDEAIAIAAALDVSPLALIFPIYGERARAACPGATGRPEEGAALDARRSAPRSPELPCVCRPASRRSVDQPRRRVNNELLTIKASLRRQAQRKRDEDADLLRKADALGIDLTGVLEDETLEQAEQQLAAEHSVDAAGGGVLHVAGRARKRTSTKRKERNS